MLEDPVLLVLALAIGRCVVCLVVAYAERLRARARVELVMAAGQLPAGVELHERAGADVGWTARSTHMTGGTGGTDAQ